MDKLPDALDAAVRNLKQGYIWKLMDMRLLEWTCERVLQEGLSFSTTIPVKTQKQIVKVVVYDSGSGKVGSRLVKMP